MRETCICNHRDVQTIACIFQTQACDQILLGAAGGMELTDLDNATEKEIEKKLGKLYESIEETRRND